MKKHIVCYSGGESSAVVAVEAVRKFGAENVVLLNHDICTRVESQDVKRFKNAVASELAVEITYANHSEWSDKDQFDVCVDAGSWVNPANRQMLCTSRLKTEPFKKWLNENYNAGDVIYYGFDADEGHRIQRRSSILGSEGFESDYPLALWSDRTIHEINEIEINKPCQYGAFKHANCIGCLKAGWQHWYIVYCQRLDIWKKGKISEDAIGYSIHKDAFLEEKEELFEKMKKAGVPQTEHMESNAFWAIARKMVSDSEANQQDFFGIGLQDQKPCECSF